MKKVKLFDRAFFYVDTEGLPLAEVMRHASAKGLATNLRAFAVDAARAGWPRHRMTAMVSEALHELRHEQVLVVQ